VSAVVIGSVLVVVTTLLAGTFIVLYHVWSGSAWRRDPMGRHVMAFVGADFLVFALAAVRLAFGASLDVGWFAWLRVVVFLAIPWTIGWRLLILWRLHRTSGRSGRG
jgi:hypothetical protein